MPLIMVCAPAPEVFSEGGNRPVSYFRQSLPVSHGLVLGITLWLHVAAGFVRLTDSRRECINDSPAIIRSCFPN